MTSNAATHEAGPGGISKTVWGELALLLAASLWGTMYPFSEWLIDRQGIGSIHMLASKFSLASAVLIPMMIMREYWLRKNGLRTEPVITRLFIFRILGNGAVVALAFGMMAIGFHWTTATNASIITATNIVFIPLIAPLMGRPRPPKIVYLAVAITMLGIALVTDLRNLQLPSIGDFCILICAICFAVHVIWITIATRDHDLFHFNAAVIIVAATVFLVLSPFEASRWPAGAAEWGAIAWLAIPGGALTGLLMFWAQRYVSESHAAVIFSVEPIVGSGLGIMFLSEPTSPFLFIGGALVLSGIFIARPTASRQDAPGLIGAAEPIH